MLAILLDSAASVGARLATHAGMDWVGNRVLPDCARYVRQDSGKPGGFVYHLIMFRRVIMPRLYNGNAGDIAGFAACKPIFITAFEGKFLASIFFLC